MDQVEFLSNGKLEGGTFWKFHLSRTGEVSPTVSIS